MSDDADADSAGAVDADSISAVDADAVDTDTASTVDADTVDTDPASDADPDAAADSNVVGSADFEAPVRRSVRRELRHQARKVAQVAGGVLFALFVLPAILAVLLPPMFEAGVPPEVFAGTGLLACYGLVAYGWRLPPFR